MWSSVEQINLDCCFEGGRTCDVKIKKKEHVLYGNLYNNVSSILSWDKLGKDEKNKAIKMVMNLELSS